MSALAMLAIGTEWAAEGPALVASFLPQWHAEQPTKGSLKASSPVMSGVFSHGYTPAAFGTALAVS